MYIYIRATADAWNFPKWYISILNSKITSWGPWISFTKAKMARWGSGVFSRKKDRSTLALTSFAARTCIMDKGKLVVKV